MRRLIALLLIKAARSIDPTLAVELVDRRALDLAARAITSASTNDRVRRVDASPEQWYDELITGGIPGLQAMPAPSRDWYAAYKTWCRRGGIPAVSCPLFVRALQHNRNVRCARKWYDIGQMVVGPHGFLMIGRWSEDERPEKARLGESTMLFRSALERYLRD